MPAPARELFEPEWSFRNPVVTRCGHDSSRISTWTSAPGSASGTYTPISCVCTSVSQHGPALLIEKYCESTRGESAAGGDGTCSSVRPGNARLTNSGVNLAEHTFTNLGTRVIVSASPTEERMPRNHR